VLTTHLGGHVVWAKVKFVLAVWFLLQGKDKNELLFAFRL